MTQEVRLFARMSAFGLIVGAAYWFLTYETAGTVLLLAFGLAAGIAAAAVFVGARAGRRRAAAAASLPEAPTERRAAGSVSVEPVPRPGWAPLGLAIGLGAVALGGAFGPLPAIGGIVITVVSARAWLGSAMRETDEAREREAAAQPERVSGRPRS
jgi:Cytochrome c oxidase subunit IV